jgi:hypothetical protein
MDAHSLERIEEPLKSALPPKRLERNRRPINVDLQYFLNETKGTFHVACRSNRHGVPALSHSLRRPCSQPTIVGD